MSFWIDLYHSVWYNAFIEDESSDINSCGVRNCGFILTNTSNKGDPIVLPWRVGPPFLQRETQERRAGHPPAYAGLE